jgi:hypothetical protein
VVDNAGNPFENNLHWRLAGGAQAVPDESGDAEMPRPRTPDDSGQDLA